MTEKLFTKKLEIGQFKVGIQGGGGFEVAAVSLKGMRNRPFPLRKIGLTEFLTRCGRKTVDGRPEEPEVILRGMPSLYALWGQLIYLWPAPLHQWTIEVRLRKREGHQEASAVHAGSDETV